MDDKNGMLYAYTIEEDGTGQALTGKDVSHFAQDKKLAWVHLDGNEPAAREWLEREASYLDHIIIDALFAEETRPRILTFDEGVMMILRGVNLNANADPEDMVSIRIWADQSRIITVRYRPLKAIKDIQDRLVKGTGPKNTGEFITALTSRLFERMEPVFSGLDDRTDNLEETIIETPDIAIRQDITNIRKQAIMFRRYIAPQKDVISHLRNADLDWLDQSHKRRLQENLDRLIRYIEDLDAIRERAQIVKDELANILADKMNKNMYVLSIVAGIFLPLGFFTGLLGINVGGMPGTDYDLAFWIVCGLCVLSAGLLLGLFKLFKWI